MVVVRLIVPNLQADHQLPAPSFFFIEHRNTLKHASLFWCVMIIAEDLRCTAHMGEIFKGGGRKTTTGTRCE